MRKLLLTTAALALLPSLAAAESLRIVSGPNGAALKNALTVSPDGSVTVGNGPRLSVLKPDALSVATPSGPVGLDNSGLLTGLLGANIKGSPNTSLFVRPAFNLPDGIVFASKSSDFSANKGLELAGSVIQLEPSQAVNILPTPGSYAQALNVVQSAPATGSIVGPFTFNKVDTTFRSAVTGDGSYGLGASGSVAAFTASINVGGPNFGATSTFGGAFGVNVTQDTTSNSDLVGLSGGLHLNAKAAGVAFGGSSGVTATATSKAAAMVGHEVDLDMQPGAIIPYRFGFNAANQGTATASTLDSAFNVETLGFPGTTNGRWKNAFTLSNYGGQLPNALADDANFFYADHTLTIANWANMGNVTVTGNIMNFRGYTVTGSAVVTNSATRLYGNPIDITVPPGQVAYGGATTTDTTKCGSLAGAKGCLIVNVGGVQSYSPFFN